MNPETYRALGLSDDEYKQILKLHGREPSTTELAMFSVEWSEHCGYMCSKPHLSQFPKKHKKYEVLVGEDSGAIVVGEHAIVFKMESHNHPSQEVPFHGAATGVGGIIRDIFTAGAYPIALLDYLCFGDIDNPETKHIMEEVIHGISSYGNCVGIPTVGGETRFDSSYNGNCLVNVMCVGVCKAYELQRARAQGVGNIVMYVGAATGRDGIGGCSVLASQEFCDGESKKPTIQIGDPFLEKCLIEATFELLKTNCVVGIKDMGAAGLTCSLVEMAAAGKVGIDATLDEVPLREHDMEAWEIMMSESQERMLVCLRPECINTAKEIFSKWNLYASIIGKVTDNERIKITYRDDVVADVSAEVLTNPPTYHLPTKASPQGKSINWRKIPEISQHNKNLVTLLTSPTIASKRVIYEQYDHMVQTNTIITPGEGDAAVLRVKDTNMAIAATTDCNSDYCQLDPYIGAQLAVYEAARNLLCVGAQPLAVTDCLNFGNPKKKDRFWYFQQAVFGITHACTDIGIPVISGNVSFYNESPLGPIKPTPTIGMVGLIEDSELTCKQYFKKSDNVILLLGTTIPDLEFSHYLKIVHGVTTGRPPTLVSTFHALQEAMPAIMRFINSAHDCSDGGIAVALAECCFGPEPIGAHIILTDFGERHDMALFNERQNRIIISCEPKYVNPIIHICFDCRVDVHVIGWTGGDSLRVTHNDELVIDQDIRYIKTVWESALQ